MRVGGGCTPIPFYNIYHHVESCGVRSSWESWAGIFKESLGARNRGGIELSYRSARLHRLAEFIPWDRFLGFINVWKYGLGYTPPLSTLLCTLWETLRKCQFRLQTFRKGLSGRPVYVCSIYKYTQSALSSAYSSSPPPPPPPQLYIEYSREKNIKRNI